MRVAHDTCWLDGLRKPEGESCPSFLNYTLKTQQSQANSYASFSPCIQSVDVCIHASKDAFVGKALYAQVNEQRDLFSL